MNIDEELKVCEAATPEPWYYINTCDGSWDLTGIYTTPEAEHGKEVIATQQDYLEVKRVDGDFICHARTGYPAALQKLKAIEALCEGKSDIRYDAGTVNLANAVLAIIGGASG